MNNCPICNEGQLITKISSAGEETFCKDCRRIIVSSSLGFVFTAAGEEGIEECKGPDSDPRPGFKGPGERAKCHLYDAGDDDQKKLAMEKAKNSAYSSQHKKTASKIINATGLFTLNPAGQTLIGQTPTASPTTLVGDGRNTNALRAQSGPAREESAAGDIARTVQMGDLNGANPLNSGTTASKKLAVLIEEDIKNREAQEALGTPICTKCNTKHTAGACNGDL
jgi:hypothetical protein